MHRSQLPIGGYFAIFAFVVSVAAGAFWFSANSTAQAGTGDLVTVQAYVTEKTTVHRPFATTTNGVTTLRLEDTYLVTLAFQDGRKPPQTIEQQVNGAFFFEILVNDPVRVTLDAEKARIVDITPGVIADPTRFLTTAALGLIFVGLGIGAAIWRRRTFETPPG